MHLVPFYFDPPYYFGQWLTAWTAYASRSRAVGEKTNNMQLHVRV